MVMEHKQGQVNVLVQVATQVIYVKQPLLNLSLVRRRSTMMEMRAKTAQQTQPQRVGKQRFVNAYQITRI